MNNLKISIRLGIDLSYDDLRTNNNAFPFKETSWGIFELSANYGFSYDQRNRSFMPTDGSIGGFRQTLQFMQINHLLEIHLILVFIILLEKIKLVMEKFLFQQLMV